MYIIFNENIENKIILFKTDIVIMENNSMIRIDKNDIATSEIINFCNDLFDVLSKWYCD